MICTIGGNVYSIKIMPDYEPAADLAIKWGTATNGKRIKTDRGATADVHRCSIRVMGDTMVVRAVYSALTQRGTDRITSATLEAGEFLFGPTTPIDAAPVETVWENIGELTQRTLTTSGFDATIALNAALVYDVAAPVLPFTVRPIASATILVDNQFTARPFYDVSTSGFDGIQATADSAEYRFSFVANRAEAGAMQTWYESVNRGGAGAQRGHSSFRQRLYLAVRFRRYGNVFCSYGAGVLARHMDYREG